MSNKPCMETSPPEASTIAVLCSMPQEHHGDHVAANSARMLCSWTQEGEVVFHYDHNIGTTTRVKEKR